MIENVVALTKLYHNEKLPLDKGKWVFGQILLKNKLAESGAVVKVVNRQNIEGRFSRNHIFIDGVMVGDIRFIVA